MNTNWCTYCDSAVDVHSNSLYCSDECLRADALRNHPSLGYKFTEFVDFPRAIKRPCQSSSTSTTSSAISINNSTPFSSNVNSVCSSPANMDLCSKYFESYDAIY
ncbi:hypothetical protein K501DRAFT_286409 [Backusella circina FSU 941]|nr:hypothetical protein K501DRAFT_286409 [Backusella circina FSU 941]